MSTADKRSSPVTTRSARATSAVRGPFRDGTVDAADLVDEPSEEPAHSRLLVMTQPGAREQLRVGDDRHDERLPTRELANTRIGGEVEGVIAVEEAGDRDRVEERHHSSRIAWHGAAKESNLPAVVARLPRL
jgi:hypothetical protein